ncbi:MAG: tRNA dihydrouridine synthase [Planctomycetota bacterium]
MTLELKPFRIGGLTIDLPLILAPLAGYSDQPFRMLCRRLGAPFCATEMLLDKSLLLNEKLRRRLVQLCDGDHPLAGQLIGNQPHEMAAAAVKLQEMGLDVIDLNFACPVRKALARRRGGYLMREPDQIIAITAAVIEAVDLPVTVKVRRSFFEEDETHDDLWRILDGVFSPRKAGAAAAAVHTRSVKAMYSGPADWELLTEIKRRYSSQTIIGSGDIHNAQAAVDMLQTTGVDAVLAARGALGNPWIFQQLRDLAAGREPHQPSVAEQRDTLRRHFDHAVEVYGPKKGPRIMRKFGIRYARMHPRPKAVRIAFVAVKTPEEWHAVLDELYADGT